MVNKPQKFFQKMGGTSFCFSTKIAIMKRSQKFSQTSGQYFAVFYIKNCDNEPAPKILSKQWAASRVVSHQKKKNKTEAIPKILAKKWAVFTAPKFRKNSEHFALLTWKVANETVPNILAKTWATFRFVFRLKVAIMNRHQRFSQKTWTTFRFFFTPKIAI